MPTHFSTHKTFTNVDISLVSVNLATICEWKILNNLFGSDHNPIFIHIFNGHNSYPCKPTPKFKTHCANWSKFIQMTDKFLKQRTPCTNINKEAAQIQKSIVSAAHHSISQTKPISRKYKVPWWNKDLQTLRTNKQKAWYEYKSRRTDELLIVYKKAKATLNYIRKKLYEVL